MDHPWILSACRTPIGRFGGRLSKVSSVELGAAAISSALGKSGLPANIVDEAIMGMVLPAGAGQAPARQAALKAGLSPGVGALTINKMCGSGLKAVMLANSEIRSGNGHVIIAGGMESMSNAPYVLPRRGPKFGDRSLIDSMWYDGLTCSFSNQAMGVIADQLARTDGISRIEQDEYACESHRRAAAAADQGAFEAEIVTVPVRDSSVAADEGPRRDIDANSLHDLPTAFGEGGTVTAGNASMISDGAAAVVVASKEIAQRHGCKPLAEIIGVATAGGKPEDLFIAPVDAIHRALERSGATLDEIDLLEINEAFAVQALACMNRLGLNADRVNVRGGAIALGHPIGASGARVLTTLVHTMIALDKKLGVAALCLGGGNAVAMVIRR